MASTWHRQIVIDKMADEAGIPRARAREALDALLGTVEDALRKGHKVTLTGFGTFHASERKGRMGRNPQTGQSMYVPAHRVASFRAGAGLKKALKESATPEPPAWNPASSYSSRR